MTRIQDDLFRHVNGEWLDTFEIPADRARDGAFMTLRDAAEEHVHAIIEDCRSGAVTGPDAERVGAFYGSFMDEDAIEATGVAALEPDLAPLTAALTSDDLLVALGSLVAAGVPSPFGIFPHTDPNNPDRYTMYVWQGGIGLPDEAMYREDTYADLRAAYQRHIANMLRLGGLAEDPEDAAARVMALETELAKGHWDVVATRDADKTNNPMDSARWCALAESLPLAAWAEATGFPNAFARLQVETPPFFSHLAEVWARADLEDLRLWAYWQVIHVRAPYLTREIAEENFDFYGRTLSGTPEQRERWKRGVAFVEASVGESVGKLYVERHFPPGHKAEMDTLVDHLLEAYRQSITALDWMGEDTKVKALAKVDAFVPKIGYPERWRDYSGLEGSPSSLMDNVRAAEKFETAFRVDRIDQPVDRAEWLITPQTVNAYYQSTSNEICFPAAILQDPFFIAGGDEAANYGGIGAVIGHEIGHGFDDQGSKYDPTGKLESWWTDADRSEFDKRTATLIGQYEGLVPEDLDGSEHAVNGALTIGENIGDLGGISIAIKAYQIALAARGSSLEEEPVVDGRTALQRLFIQWALVWREKRRTEESIRLLAIDPHSPPEFRCNQVVKNVPEFHEAFGVVEGDGMWLAEEDRVRIW